MSPDSFARKPRFVTRQNKDGLRRYRRYGTFAPLGFGRFARVRPPSSPT